MTEEKVSRRGYAKYAGAGIIVVAVAGAGAYYATRPSAPTTPTTTAMPPTTTVATVTTPTTRPTVAKKIDVSWGVWSWGIELIEDNVKIFNQNNPDINLTVDDLGLGTFFENLNAKYAAGNPPDIHYNNPIIAFSMWENGWIADMEDYYPEIRKYFDDIFPGVHKNYINPFTGKISGLPYFGGLFAFNYNKRHLKEAGYDKPPETWDELKEQAIAIKKKKIVEYPLSGNLGAYGWSETLYDFILGLGKPPTGGDGYLFDKDLNPIFNSKDSALFLALRWILDAIYVDKTMSKSVVEYDEPKASQAFASGTHSFVWQFDYNLAAANAPDAKESGNCAMAINPGYGYVPALAQQYLVPKKSAEKGKETLDAIWRVMQFLGGKTTNTKPDFEKGEYFVCKRLALEKGVSPVYRSLWKDPEIIAAYGKWVDPEIMAKQWEKAYITRTDPRQTPWLVDWIGAWGTGLAVKLIHSLIIGERGHSDKDILAVLTELENAWNEQKKKASKQY